jgi:glyoxylate reductase
MYLDILREHFNVTRGRPEDGADEFQTSVRVAEGLLVSDLRIEGELLAQAKRLRAISTISVGLDHIDLVKARQRGIAVTNTPVLGDTVADLAFALLIMLSRKLLVAREGATSNAWPSPIVGNDLAGKRLLLVGFGNIGQQVAARALASKMLVSYFDRRDGLPQTPNVVREQDWYAALEKADFVSIHVDLNADTYHLFDRDEFSHMKSTAFVINTARGAVINEGALRVALEAGEIAGAGLDVLEHEPPDADEPLLREPRAIVLPHIGGSTVEALDRMTRMAISNLVHALSPQPSEDA